MQHRHVTDKGEPLPAFVCSYCKDGNCANCMDVVRVSLNLPELCKCRRLMHAGEPVDNQLLDPETHTVYGPGLEVNIDGEVK